MSAKPETQAGMDAVREVLEKVPQRFIVTAANVGIAKEARNSIDAVCKDLYESAENYAPTKVDQLEDRKRYAALCLMCMKHEPRTRTKINMVMHLGKVFGHDMRTVEVKDVTTVRDLVRRFQEEFKPTIESTAVVKGITNGTTATGRDRGT